MGLFDGIFKGVTKILDPVSSVVGLVNGISQGGAAQRAANRTNDQLRQLAQQYLAASGNAGNLATQLQGSVTPNLDLLSGTAYRNLEDPYSDRNIDAQIQGYREDQGRNLDNATAQIAARTPMTGVADSSQMQNANLRAAINQANSINDFARNLRIQGGVQRYMNSKAQEDAQVNRVMGLMPYLLNAQGQSMSGIGGAANILTGNRQFSDNQAGQFADSVASTVNALGKAGQIGTANTGANAGKNKLGTNQAGVNPIAMNSTVPTGFQGTSGSGAGTQANPLFTPTRNGMYVFQ